MDKSKQIVIESITSWLQEPKESELLKEDIKTFVKKLNPAKINTIMGELKTSAKKLDISKFKKILLAVPKVPYSKVKSHGKKISPDFDKSYSLSKKHLSKYSEVPDKAIDILSSTIAITAGLSKDSVKQTKDFLSKIDGLMRKTIKRKILSIELIMGVIIVVATSISLSITMSSAGVVLLGVGIVLTCIGLILPFLPEEKYVKE